MFALFLFLFAFGFDEIVFEPVSMSIHGDATVSVVAIDSRVQLVTCHATFASSTFQMLDEGGQVVEVLFAGTLDGKLWSLVLG